jgi:hypothetical protein
MNYNLFEVVSRFYAQRTHRIRLYYNFRGAHQFVDRKKDANKLVVILIGYKAEFWPFVLQRAITALDSTVDVCLAMPGVRNLQLEQLAAERGWSIIQTKDNKLSLAINLAIKHHPNARYVFKMDEDIYLCDNIMQELEDTWLRLASAGIFELGFLSPLINVNGVCARYFLERLGHLDVFEDRFGTCRVSAMDTPVFASAAAAQFIWDKSLPIKQVQSYFLNQADSPQLIPFHYSIGAIFFERDLWSRMHGFTVASPGKLGVEESDLCAYCCDNSLAMYYDPRLVVGHLGFGPQKEAMTQWLSSNGQHLLA